ncbi:MAG TPA: hypothetical protein VMK32_10320 [Burkholderiaceae bacterium]|nr:hypothetical protein [Burkholderiaceae bacterium]
MLTDLLKSTSLSLALLAGGLLLAGAVEAQGFSALASPPRFELSSAPGSRSRNVLEITNAGLQPAKYRIKTADWSFAPDASVMFYDALQPGSCRPWVAIERSELLIPGGGRARFRFEVAPPADAQSGECRFALLIEGDEPVVAGGDVFRIPVRGRLGVIVYVAVGDAAPKLEVVKVGFDRVGDRRVPTVWVRNTGNAHGRVGGFLSGTDARGRELEFSPSSFPVLPGETRALSLAAQAGPNEPVDPAFPVTVQGMLEWPGARVPFEHRFE